MVQLKLNGHEIFEQLCALATEVKINVQFLNLLTLRKNLIKKLRFINKCVICQPVLTKKTERWKLGFIKVDNNVKKKLTKTVCS